MRLGIDMFEIVFFLMFFLVFGLILMAVIKSILQWNKNNHMPRLAVEAIVVGKRTHHSSSGGSDHHHSSTTYYATFQVESGDRMEFHLKGTDYGMLMEGDRGKLFFQGTRYLGFERF